MNAQARPEGDEDRFGRRFFEVAAERLREICPARAECDLAGQVLVLIVRNLDEDGVTCLKNANQLRDLRVISTAMTVRSLTLLEEIGAISRIRNGRGKQIRLRPGFGIPAGTAAAVRTALAAATPPWARASDGLANAD